MQNFRQILSLIAILILAGLGYWGWLSFSAQRMRDRAPATPDAIVVIGTDSFEFEPADIEVVAGSEVTIEFRNAGLLEHNWVVVSDDVALDSAEPTDALNDIATTIVRSGGSEVTTFIAPEPGDYSIVCTVPGHAAGGMVGTLTTSPP